MDGALMRRARTAGDDSGVTLVELVTSLALATVVGAIFTTAVVQLYRVWNRMDSLDEAQRQVHSAFVRLDQQIRYASGITLPGQAGNDWYAEFVTTNTGPAVCTQLRLQAATSQLQQRTWTRGTTPPTAWSTLASYVTEPTPFTFYEANSYGATQQLRVALSSTLGTGNAAASRQTIVTFTARNTSLMTQLAQPAKACIVRGR